MPTFIKKDGAWIKTESYHYKENREWKTPTAGWVKVGREWKELFKPAGPSSTHQFTIEELTSSKIGFISSGLGDIQPREVMAEDGSSATITQAITGSFGVDFKFSGIATGDYEYFTIEFVETGVVFGHDNPTSRFTIRNLDLRQCLRDNVGKTVPINMHLYKVKPKKWAAVFDGTSRVVIPRWASTLGSNFKVEVEFLLSTETFQYVLSGNSSANPRNICEVVMNYDNMMITNYLNPERENLRHRGVAMNEWLNLVIDVSEVSGSKYMRATLNDVEVLGNTNIPDIYWACEAIAAFTEGGDGLQGKMRKLKLTDGGDPSNNREYIFSGPDAPSFKEVNGNDATEVTNVQWEEIL